MMNGMTESILPKTRRCSSPRPPAVGEEIKKFNDTSQPYSEPYKNWNMDYQSKTLCAEYVDRSFTPIHLENATESDCKINASNPSPPPPYKWAQSLLCLLDDAQGVALFQQFLQQEGQDLKCLAFWFACRGVKKCDPGTRDGLIKLINVLFEKKVKRISAISAETKEDIKLKLSSGNGVDETIFDTAQHEVEAHMMKTTYPSFLRSDLYIQHLGNWQNEYSSEKECTVSPESVDLLPTVHEDSELQITCNKIPLTRSNLLQKKIPSISKLKQDGPSEYLKSPYSNYSSYHSKYGSFLPTSAQDSELQSLSSDAQTDDSMSLADSNMDYPTHNRNKQKRQNKLFKMVLNKDDAMKFPPTFISRTERLPLESLPKDGNDKEFYPIAVKKLNKYIEEERSKEKVKLKVLESSECSKLDVISKSANKPNATPFEPGFLCAPCEENAQDIIDEHISRVFDSGQHSPAISSGCLSPQVIRTSGDVLDRSHGHQRVINCEPSQEILLGTSRKHGGASQFTVPNSIKFRRDHDTHSTDSAMFDCVSDDNKTSNCRIRYSSLADSELVDYSQRSREHSRCYGDKKFSSMTDSHSSLVDSGISVAYESVPPSSSKVAIWLQRKRIAETEREHMWRNSPTSSVLNQTSYNCKTAYSSSRSGGQERMFSQWCTTSQQFIPQDPSFGPVFPPPDTTSNLIGARRRLEDEGRVKQKVKCASASRNSHDPLRLKCSKGHDTFDDGICQRKQSRRSCPTGAFETTSVSSTSSGLTVIGYSYGRHSVPYLSKIPGKNITLRQFKSLLSKKGNFRYFFKTANNELGTGVVFQEVSDESSILPMWEGKVFCVIEPMDDNSTL